jgi:hypothetical protein
MKGKAMKPITLFKRALIKAGYLGNVVGNTKRGLRVRLSYYYRPYFGDHVIIPQEWGQKVADKIGPDFTLVDTEDDWAAWPKISYYSAYFTYTPKIEISREQKT